MRTHPQDGLAQGVAVNGFGEHSLVSAPYQDFGIRRDDDKGDAPPLEFLLQGNARLLAQDKIDDGDVDVSPLELVKGLLQGREGPHDFGTCRGQATGVIECDDRLVLHEKNASTRQISDTAQGWTFESSMINRIY